MIHLPQVNELPKRLTVDIMGIGNAHMDTYLFLEKDYEFLRESLNYTQEMYLFTYNKLDTALLKNKYQEDLIRLLKEDNRYLAKDNISKANDINALNQKIKRTQLKIKILSGIGLGTLTYILIQSVKK